MQFHYSTDTKDLRSAMYYGVLMRNAAFGRIMLVLPCRNAHAAFSAACGSASFFSASSLRFISSDR